jgi:hypothetical protein
MAFIYFLSVLGILGIIGIIWNVVAMRKEDKEASGNAASAIK